MAATAADRVSVFTAAMRSEFMNAYNALRPVEMTPWRDFTLIVPSTARIEEYPWMSPPPRLKRYLGKRNYTIPDFTKMRVENLEYSAEEAFRLRDVEDIQQPLDGYKLRMAAMAADVKDFPGRETMKLLRDNAVCFDGSNFFADSHTIGTGDNSLTYNCASNDGTANTVVALLTAGPIKPILWQQRKDEGIEDNTGTKEMRESKMVRYWYDYEGAAAFGFWWDAIKMAVTDTPTLTEMQDIIRQIEAAFRGFKLDKADVTDDDYFIHEQLVFSPSTITYVVNPNLENLIRTALNAETITLTGGPATNVYQGHGKVVVSGYLGS